MRPARVAGLVAVVALALLPALEEGRGRTDGARVGPLAELGADLAWLRFQGARRAGDPERAVRLATLALERAPSNTTGWQLLAGYLGYELCSPATEPSLARRRGWLEAALACAADGERRADARELALTRALLLWNKAESDPRLGSPDGDPHEGARRLLARAAAAFATAGEEALAARAQARAAR